MSHNGSDDIKLLVTGHVSTGGMSHNIPDDIKVLVTGHVITGKSNLTNWLLNAESKYLKPPKSMAIKANPFEYFISDKLHHYPNKKKKSIKRHSKINKR
jgi:hypothetical protein